MDAAMQEITNWLAAGYLSGLGFVVLILLVRRDGGR